MMRARLNCCPRRHAAFTLLEMIVVVLIIGLVVGVTAPMLVATLDANAIDNSVNDVSASLSTARAIALEKAKFTALMFFANELDPEIVEMRVMEVNTSDTPMVLTAVKERSSNMLARRIKMGGAYFYFGGLDWMEPTSASMAVCFGPDGVVRNSTPLGDWDLVDDEGEKVRSIPFLVLYDEKDFELSGASSRKDWINLGTPEARVLMFNRYTGQLMRKKKDES